MTVTSAKLQSDADWQALQKVLEGSQSIQAVEGVLRRARELGAISVIVEEDYLGRLSEPTILNSSGSRSRKPTNF